MSSAASCAVHARPRCGYSLVSCVVSPAFLFSKFELMQAEEVTRLRVAEQMAKRVLQQRQVAEQAQAARSAAGGVVADGSAALPAAMSEQLERRKIERLHQRVLRE